MTTEAAPKDKAVAAKRKTLPELLNDEATQKRFEQMLGKDSRSFQQNILTVFNGSKSLQECDPDSIIAACAVSASINLSILPSLGQSCVVPYKDPDGRLVAQWQIQWKGLIQLAHRSGQYERINLARVYEGELVAYDKFKGIITLDEKRKKSDRVMGYYYFFKLNERGGGGTFEFYWSAKECVEHGLRYSKSFQKGNGKWTEDPEFEKAGSVKKWLDGKEHFLTEGSGADAMSGKTIVKNETNTWGPLETRIKEIVSLDQAVIGVDGAPKYIDTTAEPASDKTYTPPPSGTAKGPDGEPFPAEKIKWARDAAGKQGVSGEHFDAWLAEQVGDEAAKATAAEEAWKQVAMKKLKASEAFALKAKPAAEAATKERTVRIGITGVASSEFEGEDATAIRDASEPTVKYFTTNPEVIEQAKAIKDKASKTIAVVVVDRVSGGKTFGWIDRLA